MGYGPEMGGGPDITVQTKEGSATFRRNGENSASLKLNYNAEGGTAQLNDKSLAGGIAEIYVKEVSDMRASIAELGTELSSQLSADGVQANLNNSYQYRDSRTWSDDKTAFTVDGSTTAINTEVSVQKGVSDASIVQEMVGAYIKQREEGIHGVYSKIMFDAHNKRGVEAPMAA
jgi:hypothetical protein